MQFLLYIYRISRESVSFYSFIRFRKRTYACLSFSSYSFSFFPFCSLSFIAVGIFSSANKFRIFACNIREKDDRDEELWKVTAVRIFQSYPKFIERYLFFVFTTPRFRVSIKIFIRVYLSRHLVSRKRSRFVFLERKRRKLELFDWFFRTWMEMDI